MKPAQTTIYGSRTDQLVYKTFTSGSAGVPSHQSGSINLIDWPLTQSAVTNMIANNCAGGMNQSLDKFKQVGMVQFDINNNATMLSYPSIISPTSAKEFRQVIAARANEFFIPLWAPASYYAHNQPWHVLIDRYGVQIKWNMSPMNYSDSGLTSIFGVTASGPGRVQ
jgi:hypothetical protein